MSPSVENVRVAVQVAAVDRISFPAALHPVVADAAHVLGFARMDRLRGHRRQSERHELGPAAPGSSSGSSATSTRSCCGTNERVLRRSVAHAAQSRPEPSRVCRRHHLVAAGAARQLHRSSPACAVGTGHPDLPERQGRSDPRAACRARASTGGARTARAGRNRRAARCGSSQNSPGSSAAWSGSRVVRICSPSKATTRIERDSCSCVPLRTTRKPVSFPHSGPDSSHASQMRPAGSTTRLGCASNRAVAATALDRSPAGAVEAAQIDVVTPGGVSVPGDRDGVARGRDRRPPVVARGRRVAQGSLIRPVRAVERARPDAARSPVRVLPDKPHMSAAVGGRAVIEVRDRRRGSTARRETTAGRRGRVHKDPSLPSPAAPRSPRHVPGRPRPARSGRRRRPAPEARARSTQRRRAGGHTRHPTGHQTPAMLPRSAPDRVARIEGKSCWPSRSGATAKAAGTRSTRTCPFQLQRGSEGTEPLRVKRQLASRRGDAQRFPGGCGREVDQDTRLLQDGCRLARADIPLRGRAVHRRLARARDPRNRVRSVVVGEARLRACNRTGARGTERRFGCLVNPEPVGLDPCLRRIRVQASIPRPGRGIA